MEDKSTTISQICCDVFVKEVPKDEFLNFWRSPDISPEPRRFSFHERSYNDSQLRLVQKRAINRCVGPRHVEYSTLQGRLNSFKDEWPVGKIPTPEALSTAGFFYDGEFTSNFD
jgi:hypothetical protein